jgi:hypothetical protein
MKRAGTTVTQSLGLGLAGLVPLVALVVVFAGGGTREATGASAAARVESEQEQAPVSAEAFADVLAGTTNRYAMEHGDPARISRADCVQASPGRYMCSYVVEQPGEPRACHLMQARWTPHAASTFTVTLAGRTGRCGSLSEALETLR